MTMKVANKVGLGAGFVAGIAVTGALGLSPKWNRPLIKDGHPVQVRVKGHDYGLKVRHEPVVGPKVLDYAAKMPAQTRLQEIKRALVTGFGEGASKAPLAEARFEAEVTKPQW
jgi:hypothetical protein